MLERNGIVLRRVVNCYKASGLVTDQVDFYSWTRLYQLEWNVLFFTSAFDMGGGIGEKTKQIITPAEMKEHCLNTLIKIPLVVNKFPVLYLSILLCAYDLGQIKRNAATSDQSHSQVSVLMGRTVATEMTGYIMIPPLVVQWPCLWLPFYGNHIRDW